MDVHLTPWFFVIIAGVPQIKGSKKSKLEALPGADVVIRCPVEQSPNLIIEWYKDGSFVDAVLNLFKMGRKGSLTIFNVTVEDSGTYVCKAINGFGTAEVSVSLVIQGTSRLLFDIISLYSMYIQQLGHRFFLNLSLYSRIPELFLLCTFNALKNHERFSKRFVCKH